VASDLHSDELLSEGLDVSRKSTHHLSNVALIFSLTVLQGSIDLTPSRLAAVGTGGANQQICATDSENVEYSVIGRAYGSAQFGLSGTAPVPANRPGR
jgi:hypothetical protein